jgi:hypothetical protein
MKEHEYANLLPAVPAETLTSLHEAALALRGMEPWRWMREEDLFGLIEPATGELHIAAILGKEEGPPGLVLYRGEPGYRFLFRKRDDVGSPIDPALPMEEDSLLVEFVPARELQSEDLRRIEVGQSSVASAPKKGARRALGLPKFRSHLPAHLPWFPDTAECELLTTVLVLAQAFTALVDEDPDFYGKRAYEEVPVYSRVGKQADSPWKLDWMKLDLSPKAGPPPWDASEAELKLCGNLPQQTELRWEMDTFFPPTLIPKAARPYYPRAAVIADAGTGRFIDVDLVHPSEAEGWQAGRVFLQNVQRAKCRPFALHVASATLAEALWPIAEAIGVRVRVSSILQSMPPIREYLARRLAEESAA